LTISAIAERNCALLAADRGWTIDYSLTSPIVTVPSPALKPSLQFTETMKGFFAKGVSDDFQKGFNQGKQNGSSFQFILTIISDDVEKMLTDAAHEERVVGKVKAEGLSADDVQVREGT